MGKVSKWILWGITSIVVTAALLVTGLRLAMPYLNQYREHLFSSLSSLTGVDIQAKYLDGRWMNYGPTVAIDQLSATLSDGSHLHIAKVTLALDVWQSLLHTKLQFRDLTFQQLHFSLKQLPQTGTHPHRGYDSETVKTLFLQRFDHFILRDSTVDFPSPSGQRVTLDIPALTWFNEGQSHRAEGLVSLSSFTGQHGTAQLRVNLIDKQGVLDKGKIWFSADDIDAKPWLGRWTSHNTMLKKAHLSVSAWLNIEQGMLSSGDLLVSRGNAQWQDAEHLPHQLTLDQLTAHLTRVARGFALTVPTSHVAIDQQRWPHGALAAYWQPEKNKPWQPSAQSNVRIRAQNIRVERLTPLVTLFAPLIPEYAKLWQQANPQGVIQQLAVDIPTQEINKSRFQAAWHDLGWQAWQQVPALKALSGSISGEAKQGLLHLHLGAQTLASQGQLQAPLELTKLHGTFGWDTRQQKLLLAGQDIYVQAKSITAQGDFRYQKTDKQAPQLDILAGINVTNGADAWRYFPIKIMPKALVHYLSTAIQGGTAKNATLLFAGNPHQFPFQHNEGMFQVSVPLKQATFAFQPGWPALTPLDIDLNFVNNGLWMKAAAIKLGNVDVREVSANIPDYQKEQLLIDGDIRGQGDDVHDYMKQTPLSDSVGSALDQLKVKGEVFGHLALTIPLDGKPVIAQGDVNLRNNELTVVPLASTLTDVTGRFTYHNGTLASGPLTAQWFGQPINVAFTTSEQPDNFGVAVHINGDWQLENISAVPKALRRQVQGQLPWSSDVAIQLPHHGETRYQVNVTGQATQVRGELPRVLGLDVATPLPINAKAVGDLHQLTVSGAFNRQQHFVTRWLLSSGLTLDRGIWDSQSANPVQLPERSAMIIHLPALDATKLYRVISQSESPSRVSSSAKTTSVPNSTSSLINWRTQVPFKLPQSLVVTTPQLTAIGQKWRNLTLTAAQLFTQPLIKLQGDEVRGEVTLRSALPWLISADYLYYNPQFSSSEPTLHSTGSTESRQTPVDFQKWPAIDAICRSCWFAGQNFGQVKGRLNSRGNTLSLSEGEIDTGNSRLTINGEWHNADGDQRTALKGRFTSDNFAKTAHWFGKAVPISDTPLDLRYDLHWHNAPWQPEISNMSGLLTLNTGKGAFQHVGTGTAGQILRLLSIDALLRKLSLDFRGTFDSGFYYDSIVGTAWMDQGILHTDNLKIDGLEADIAMSGKVDFAQRQFDLLATVAPEISVPVGVAAAFAINPIVGASVFVASKILSPLWSKISLLRYSISGPMDKPQVKEVLRK